ncbi:unnamed protein product, partial [Scytosiphon promiscuus]
MALDVKPHPRLVPRVAREPRAGQRRWTFAARLLKPPACVCSRPTRANDGDRCVRRMDHHCRWVGRCVGAGNYK